MDKWAELRTAYMVGELGTVSAAAAALGVHRATVNRHIDALEAALGDKVFQRHARGYTLTDVGREALKAARRTDALMRELEGRVRARGAQLTGELVLASLTELAAMLTPAVAAFRAENPMTTVRLVTGEALTKLEYGEAHVAVRAGRKPTDADYVVQPLRSLGFGLYAHADYVARRGAPKRVREFHDHDFIAGADGTAPGAIGLWMRKYVPQDRVVVKVTFLPCTEDAVMAGVGIGFLPERRARERSDLVAVMPPRHSWGAPLWLVTHVDLHQTAKVQAMLRIIKTFDKRDWAPSPA